jgi:hypothetical protein
MARVTEYDVQDILPTTIPLHPFILAATTIVDHHLGTLGLSAALLKEIERWLTAHLVCVRQPRWTEMRDGDTATVLEQGDMGKGLYATRYGAQVALLDPTGILVGIGVKKRAYIKVD